MIKRSLLAMPLLVLCFHLHAQQQGDEKNTTPTAAQQPLKEGKVITGSVNDAVTGKAIGGARITYKNLYAAITDSTGKFSIKVPDYSVAVRIDADGFQSKEVALKGRKNFNASLYESDFQSFYDDVTTPFGTEPKSHLTTAATSIQTNGSWSNISETPDAYLQGKVAGLNVIRRSGTPNMGANLFLRGLSSLYATNQPLVVVDGVVYDASNYGNSIISSYVNNPFSFIDPRDIDNITVIKDGSSIYGTKGANGVILITTARAHQEATRIDAGFYGGINTAPVNLPVMNVSDYRVYLTEMLQSKGLSYKETQALPYMNDDESNPDYYRYHANNNWQNKVFKNSYTKNGYLKITGGDNIAKYALSIGFLKNDGVINNTDLTRYNTRFNADLNLSKRLTATTNLSFTYNEQNLKDLGISFNTNPVYAALVKAPFLPEHDLTDEGVESPTLADRDSFRISNPSALIQDMQAMNRSYRFMGSAGFNYLLNNNFSLGTTIAVTIDKIRESFFVPEKGVVSDTLSNAIAFNRSGAQVLRMFNVFNDTRLSYNKTFNKIHQVSAHAGIRYNRSKTEQDNGFGFNSATDQYTGVGYGLNSLRQIGGSMGEWAWFNSYVNADYNFSGKYFLSVNVAVDGSSRFGSKANDGAVLHAGDKNYPVLPSVSAAWLISSENFMAHNNIIDLLKLRAFAGMSGNDDIGNYTARNYYVPQNFLGIAGLVRGNIGNPELQWETVTKLNAGADVALLNERLNVSVDAYRNKTDNMIVFEPAPTSSGMDYRITNSGAMKTTGLEATVNARLINKKNLKWDVGFNVAHYKSVITQLPMDAIQTPFADGTILTQTGGAPNLFYGYKTNGVYTSDAEAAAAGLVNKNADGTTNAFTGGDVRFIDVNGDHIIDENDRQIIGNPNPDFFGGITNRLVYKNWSLEALFTFSQGNDVYNFTRRQLESMTGYANQTEAVINRWHTNGQVTDMPRATWGDPLGNSRFSDRWIEDGSYLRLRTLSVAYNIPLKQGFVRNATVYLTGNNVVTFTNYKGYDPEFSASSSVFGQGVDVMLEPQYRSVQVGVRLGL